LLTISVQNLNSSITFLGLSVGVQDSWKRTNDTLVWIFFWGGRSGVGHGPAIKTVTRIC